jgi:hypothetical protein
MIQAIREKRFRASVVDANGRAGVGFYRLGDDGVGTFLALQVLEAKDGRIRVIDHFTSAGSHAAFFRGRPAADARPASFSRPRVRAVYRPRCIRPDYVPDSWPRAERDSRAPGGPRRPGRRHVAPRPDAGRGLQCVRADRQRRTRDLIAQVLREGAGRLERALRQEHDEPLITSGTQGRSRLATSLKT